MRVTVSLGTRRLTPHGGPSRVRKVSLKATASGSEAPDAYNLLRGVQVFRATDGAEVELVKQWNEDDRLRRDVIPVTDAQGSKVFLVSIGTAQRAKDFIAKTGFPAERLFADPENAAYSALGLYKGVQRTFFSGKTAFAMRDRIVKDRASDVVDVLKEWTPWIPPKLDQSLQQGGLFIFEGQRCVWSHYDESTSDHADLNLVLNIVTNPSKEACSADGQAE